MKASQSAADAAKAQYDQAVAGARSEDKAAANALVMQARGASAEVDAYLEETKIRSPITGEVSLKLAEEGEVVGSGMPVVAVTDLNDAWAVFHLREDLLKNVYKGRTLTLHVPALDKDVEMSVSYIASVGDYATWRSSKESGGWVAPKSCTMRLVVRNSNGSKSISRVAWISTICRITCST